MNNNNPFAEFEDFAAQHGISVTPKEQPLDNGSIFYRLNNGCAFDSTHHDAGIIVWPGGAKKYSCPHHSCADKRWRDFLQLVAPDYRPSKPARIEAATPRFQSVAAEQAHRDFSKVIARRASEIDFTRTKEPKHIIEGLLTDGAYFLDGSSKVGKSRLLLQMMLSICSGDDFMNRHTMQGACLYLAFEDLREDYETRLQKFCCGAVPPDNLYTLTKEDFTDFITPRLGEAGGLSELINAHMAEHPETLVIGIDVFGVIRSDPQFKDFTMNERADIDELLRLAARYQIAVIVAHHISKTGQQMTAKADTSIGAGAGSYAISGSVIGELSLTRDPDDRRFAILRGEGRRTRSSAIYMEDIFPRWVYRKEYGQKIQEDIEEKNLSKTTALVETAVYLVNRNGDKSKGWKGSAKEFKQENEMNQALPPITFAVDRNTFTPIAHILKARGVAYQLVSNGNASPLHWFTKCAVSVDHDEQIPIDTK